MSKKEEKIYNYSKGLLYNAMSCEYKITDNNLLAFADQFDTAVRHNNNTTDKELARLNILIYILNKNLLNKAIDTFNNTTHKYFKTELYSKGFDVDLLNEQLLNIRANGNIKNAIDTLSAKRSKLLNLA